MSYPKFRACNHGCQAAKPVGMCTNGGCKFPNLSRLKQKCDLFQGYHDDVEVRQFARQVEYLIAHIEAAK